MNGKHSPLFVASRAAVLVVSALAAASCHAIAGIEDREYTATGQQSSPLCEDYCTTVMETCIDKDDADPREEQHNSVYPSKDACLAFCQHLEAGDMNERPRPSGDTVACRLASARLAKNSREFTLYCPEAGPGGAGACGDDCENYCKHFEELCGGAPEDCVEKCAVFPNDGSFDAIRDHDGDTLQCRLVHLTNAALDEAHCGHAAFRSTQYCIVPKVTCEHYCHVVTTTCSGANEVYEDEDQCLRVCSFLELGEPDDQTEDTIGCRTYHALNSYVTDQPATHCPHAGPGGDNHCGVGTGNCPPYCTLLKAACPSQFTSTYGTDAKCLEECADLEGADGETGMVVANSAGNNVMCRLVEISGAFDDPSRCAAAVGQAAPCR